MNENAAGPLAATNTQDAAEATATPEMAELEADIARTREDLADTVDQLTAKLDVKARVRNRATDARDAATAQVRSARQHLVDADGKPRPTALGVGGGVLAAIAAVVLVKLWRRPARHPSRRRGRRR
jgi:Protein of unknown function (DUF3618)